MKPKDALPPTDGLRFYLENQIRVIARPSGTEPKVKFYIEVVCKSAETSERARAEEIISTLTPVLTGYFQ